MLQPIVPKIMKALIDVENRILGKIADHVIVKKIWHNLAVEDLLSNTIDRRSRFIQSLEFMSYFDLHAECKLVTRDIIIIVQAETGQILTIAL
jgi:hypothetical protein